jgi:hypothetical protein
MVNVIFEAATQKGNPLEANPDQVLKHFGLMPGLKEKLKDCLEYCQAMNTEKARTVREILVNFAKQGLF